MVVFLLTMFRAMSETLSCPGPVEIAGTSQAISPSSTRHKVTQEVVQKKNHNQTTLQPLLYWPIALEDDRDRNSSSCEGGHSRRLPQLFAHPGQQQHSRLTTPAWNKIPGTERQSPSTSPYVYLTVSIS